jgi:beta-lactamase class D
MGKGRPKAALFRFAWRAGPCPDKALLTAYLAGRIIWPTGGLTMKSKKITYTLAAIAMSLSWSSAQSGPDHGPPPLGEYAEVAETCIALYDRNSDEYRVYNMDQCQERLSPCSTFKVPNALVGLESGVLEGPDTVKAWDGTRRSREVLNQDHDLASAIENSVVWYFQDVALDIGPERMQAALDAYDYGNQDISGGQDIFWLSSSLKISALEQIRFMDALDREALPAEPEYQALVRNMMLQDSGLPDGFRGELFGKTGSCVGPEGEHGWFTGFLHRGDQRWVFAVNVKGDGQWGWQARKIAVRVLDDIH